MYELLHLCRDNARNVWVSIPNPISRQQLRCGSQEPPKWNPLTPHLLVDPDNERGLCHDFLTEAVSRFEEDDTIKSAVVGAIEDLSRQLSKMTMNDDYKPYVHVSYQSTSQRYNHIY